VISAELTRATMRDAWAGAAGPLDGLGAGPLDGLEAGPLDGFGAGGAAGGGSCAARVLTQAMESTRRGLRAQTSGGGIGNARF